MTTGWENLDDRHGASQLSFRFYEGKSAGKSPPLVLYLRGTAFLDEARPEAECLAAVAMAEAGAMVVEADYSTVSRNVFPRALECAFNAFMYVSAQRKKFGGVRSRLLVAGDESGGNLAASVALKARDDRPNELAGQILLSPMLDPQMATGSFLEADEIGMRNRWSDGWSHYLGSSCGFQHPYAAPCLCSRLTGVAPALICTSEDDPLRDETLAYADRLASSGADISRKVFSTDEGWTGIYRGQPGIWQKHLCEEFTAFLARVRM